MTVREPFWEDAYRRDDVAGFSVEPNKAVKGFRHLVDKGAPILEAGCGEGQNVLYLAREGYGDIDAFDISAAAIGKVGRRCRAAGVKINAFVADLAAYRFERDYGLVLSLATLCFVEKGAWKGFLRDAKAHTRPGGIHIMHIFTDAVPASPDIAPFALGLAQEGELRGLYGDWEILQSQSYVFEDEHPGVPKHLHAADKVVARRPV